jgi:hypothetical protein
MLLCDLRLVVEGTAAQANEVTRHIASLFADVASNMKFGGPRADRRVRGWQETWMWFEFDEAQTTFEVLVARLSDGWEDGGPRVQVWNAQVLLGGQPRAPFVDPSVRWALMEYDLPQPDAS